MGVLSKDSALSALSESVKYDCVLMFSGGRDSTLAAVRLHDQRRQMALVTIVSGHLTGIDRVKKRLHELRAVLPAETPWLCINQPTELRTDTSFYEQTCLPCHHAYVVVSALLAKTMHAQTLAFGYASYQNSWPEQTPLATSRLKALLARHGIELALPVYDLRSREDAVAQLLARGLSTDALEQKCLQQVTNVALSDSKLLQQVDLWEKAIDASLVATPGIALSVREAHFLSDL
jgi:hypothetical protein